MNKKFTFYILILLIFGALIWYAIRQGGSLHVSTKAPTEIQINKEVQNPSSYEVDNKVSEGNESKGFFPDIFYELKQNLTKPIGILVLQIIIIIIIARLFGFVFGKLGQPTVIGEIIAGIALGPSLLGLYFPDVSQFIFPEGSLNNLEMLSQVGLVLFMFIIGMELDMKVLRTKVQSALVISHTSIIISYFLGICLSLFLFERFAPSGSTFLEFALFIGIALSIAAFPVLARILQERGLTKTSIGKTIITIAAIDDMTAWCILAIVIAIIQAGNAMSAFVAILFALLYVGLMLLVGQPFMKRIGSIYISKEILNKNIVAFVFIILFLSAYITEIIGIKALFGGFMAGVIMPTNKNFKKIMKEKIEDMALVVLLPLFFVFIGLRTQIGLLNDSNLWGICGIIILFAVTGKFGGSFFAAKMIGQSWKNSFMIGTLMNIRGLMGLIVLNIGYELGILPPAIFAMMVVMALATTFMTGPILSLIDYLSRKKGVTAIEAERGLKVLISFGMPQTGGTLLRLFDRFTGKDIHVKKIAALHLTPHTEISRSDALKYEKDSFSRVKAIAHELEIKLRTIYKTTNDVTREIVKTAKNEHSDLLLMGAAKSVFAKNVLGGKVRAVIDQVPCNVGVLIDKDFHKTDNTLIIVDPGNYKQLLNLGLHLLHNSTSKVTIVDEENLQNSWPEFFNRFLLNPDDITRTEIIRKVSFENAYLEKFDLVILGLKYCEKTIESGPILIESYPSLLILEFKDDTFSMLPEEKKL